MILCPHVEFEETEERIKGRGSCDAKGPLSVFLKAFIETEIDGRLTLAVTPDEETTLQASTELDIDAESFLVGEPTNLDPCIAARGWTKLEVEFRGEAAHASEPENAVNAVKAALEAVLSLEYFHEQFNYDNDILPEPTLSATIIEGGQAENHVPETTKLTIDRRVVPPETPEEFAEKIRNHINQNIQSGAEIEVKLPEETEPLSAFETSPDADIVQVIEEESGNEPRIFDAATEASRFNDTNVVVFVPGVLADEEGGVAHSKREYVKKEKVKEAGKILVSTVESYLS